MARTLHPRPQKASHKRGSNARRRRHQKHVPSLPGGYARFSRRDVDNDARRSVRTCERADLQRMKVDPELVTMAEVRARVHWTLLEPYW